MLTRKELKFLIRSTEKKIDMLYGRYFQSSERGYIYAAEGWMRTIKRTEAELVELRELLERYDEILGPEQPWWKRMFGF